MSAVVLRSLSAVASMLMLVSMTACTADSGAKSFAANMERSRMVEKRAERLCTSWVADKPDNPNNYRLLSARDTTLGDLRTSLTAAGIVYGSDNVLSSDRQGYAALCLMQAPDRPNSRYLGYIIDDHQNGLLGAWNE